MVNQSSPGWKKKAKTRAAGAVAYTLKNGVDCLGAVC